VIEDDIEEINEALSTTETDVEDLQSRLDSVADDAERAHDEITEIKEWQSELRQMFQ